MAICLTNLIPIFITLLLNGLLFIYFNSRLAEVKNVVEKQNRVLTAFITNVQHDIRGASAGGNSSCAPPIGVNHLVSEEALNAVNTVTAVRRNENEKIVVSEDESNSEDESDNDSESSDDSDEDVEDNDKTESVKIIKLQDSCLDSDAVEVVALNIDSYIESIPTEDDTVTTLTNADVDNLKVINLDVTNEVNTINETTIEVKTTEVIDYEHMKVDDLRKIVSDKNLATKEEVKKLKKPELLAVLREVGG